MSIDVNRDQTDVHNGNECEQLCDSAAEYVARLIDEPTSAAELEPDTCALSSTAFSFSMPLASGKLRALWDALDGGSKHDQHYAVRLDAKHTERERGGSLRSAWPDSFDSDCSTADLSTDELRLWTSTSGHNAEDSWPSGSLVSPPSSTSVSPRAPASSATATRASLLTPRSLASDNTMESPCEEALFPLANSFSTTLSSSSDRPVTTSRFFPQATCHTGPDRHSQHAINCDMVARTSEAIPDRLFKPIKGVEGVAMPQVAMADANYLRLALQAQAAAAWPFAPVGPWVRSSTRVPAPAVAFISPSGEVPPTPTFASPLLASCVPVITPVRLAYPFGLLPFDPTLPFAMATHRPTNRLVNAPVNAPKPRSSAANELHLRLDECYEQFRMLEKERKRLEAELARQNPGKRVSVACLAPAAAEHRSGCPSRVDRLVSECLKEYQRVTHLASLTARLNGNALNSGVQSSLDAWLSAITTLQSKRAEELSQAGRSRASSGFDDHLVLALGVALSQLTLHTRQVRTALWCALQFCLAPLL